MTGDPFIEVLGQIVAEQGQTAVANRAGLDQSTISNLLSGKTKGNWSTLYKLVATYPELRPFLIPENAKEGEGGTDNA